MNGKAIGRREFCSKALFADRARACEKEGGEKAEK